MKWGSLHKKMSRHLPGGLGAWLVLLLWLVSPVVMAEHTVLYLTDAQGNVLMTKDVQGNVIARYTYRPYGTQQSGPSNAGPGYTGHVNDPDTGLVYMQQRYYDPEVGRFISPDPVRPTPGNVFNFNRFAYANNNPVRFIDPTGTTCVSTETGYKCKVDDNTGNFNKDEIKRINNAYTNAVNQLSKHPFRSVVVTVRGVKFRVSAGDVAHALIKATVKTGRGNKNARATTEGGYSPDSKSGQQTWLSYRHGRAITTIFHNALVKDRAGHYLSGDVDHDLKLTFGHEGIHETPNDSAMSVFSPNVFNAIHNAEYNRAGNYLVNPYIPLGSLTQ